MLMKLEFKTLDFLSTSSFMDSNQEEAESFSGRTIP